jgi:arylsulfatase A-like enzyme
VRPLTPPAVLSAAAVHGIVAASGLVLARWLTSEPWSPRSIVYDVGAFIVIFALVYLGVYLGVSRRVEAPPRRAARERPGSSAATAAAALLLGWVWAASPPGFVLHPVLRAASGVLLALAAAAFVRNVWKGRVSRLPFGGFALALGAALAAGLAVGPGAGFSSLLFPLVLLGALLPGQPAGGPSLARRDVPPLAAAAALLAVCSLTVAPASHPWIEPPRGERAARPRDPAVRSVLLIVLDNLRRDHLSLYGYPRRTTPHIDRWAAGGMVFDRATAATCWTLPSHASLFTGLVPRTHGAHGFRGTGPGVHAHALPQEETTLAELASREGIATGAVVANAGYLDPRFGVAQGFDTYWAETPRHRVDFPPVERLARALDPEGYADAHWAYYRDRHITDNVLRWLDGVGDRRFFLFVNYMDVHAPNHRPPDEVTPYLEGEESFVDPGLIERGLFLERRQLPEAVRAYRVTHYDRELTHLDRELDRLFTDLETSGLAKSTVVLLTSDHGEYFGEHGLTGHSGHLHEEVVAVPLVVRGPGVPAGRTSRPTHTVDLFGAVLDFLAVEEGRRPGISGPLPGPLWESEPSEIVSEWYASENPMLLEPRMGGRFDRDLRALQHGGWKLFEDSRGGVELYDLTSPAGESEDLAVSRPDEVERLRSRLRVWLEAHPASSHIGDAAPGTPPGADDAEARRRLRALGYLD